MRRTAALIVGGGPAGAATAIEFARARLPHLLVERSRTTGDALCGGFMSWRTLDSLDRLGIAATVLNPVRIDTVRIFAGSRLREAPLPRPALAVSRHRLDTVMLAAAVEAGAAVERGVEVRALGPDGARLADGTSIEADATFLASGKHDVRGVTRPEEARGDDPTLGLRIRLAPHPTLTRLVGHTIELHAFDRGYAGIALQEDGAANLCMAVHRSRLREAGDPRRLLAELAEASPRLGERIAFAADETRIDAIANVPYGWRELGGTPGLFRLGDQAGVIPSLAGEGMGIAIASGIAAAAAYRDGAAASASAWQHGFARRLRRPIGVAGVIRRVFEGPLAPFATTLAGARLIETMANLTRIVP